MAKQSRPRKAYATWHPVHGLNTHWIRPMAKTIREENGAHWDKIKAMGWRIVRVKVVVDPQ